MTAAIYRERQAVAFERCLFEIGISSAALVHDLNHIVRRVVSDNIVAVAGAENKNIVARAAVNRNAFATVIDNVIIARAAGEYCTSATCSVVKSYCA